MLSRLKELVLDSYKLLKYYYVKYYNLWKS